MHAISLAMASMTSARGWAADSWNPRLRQRDNRANDLLRRGDHERAIRLFTKALNLHPNDPWALNNRGVAYRQAGKERKARRDFEAALRLDPAFTPARANLEALNAEAAPPCPARPGRLPAPP